jgi:hypothetical protein
MFLLGAATFVVGNTIVWLTVAARALGWISRRTFYAGIASGQGIGLIGCVAGGYHAAAGIAAAGSTLAAWLWWNDGGGNDTRRRMKRWARRFQGVRRTAPVST